MIFYYTYQQKTKIFANSLSQVLTMPTYELDAEINKKKGFGFMVKALSLVFGRKTSPVLNMPSSVPGQIYVCSPIWGGNIAPPAKFFLENTNLQNTTVNLVLTASAPTERYKQNALKYLSNIGCNVGDVYLFMTSSKILPDQEVLTGQLTELLAGN